SAAANLDSVSLDRRSRGEFDAILCRKGCHHRLTRALAWESTPKGVRVNAVAPGPIVTDLTATMTPEDRQAFIDALLVGRFGRPEEIAATALLLAGPDGGFYVGATLSPNGGDGMY